MVSQHKLHVRQQNKLNQMIPKHTLHFTNPFVINHNDYIPPLTNHVLFGTKGTGKSNFLKAILTQLIKNNNQPLDIQFTIHGAAFKSLEFNQKQRIYDHRIASP